VPLLSCAFTTLWGRGAREVNLIGFRFLAVLLLELGLRTRNVLVRVGCQWRKGTYEFLLLGVDLLEREISTVAKYHEQRERARTSFLSFSSC